MCKNKNQDGALNICGARMKKLRMSLKPPVSQRMLADKLQLIGMDLDKNAIRKIESGKRVVTDIEIVAFAGFFDTTTENLLEK